MRPLLLLTALLALCFTNAQGQPGGSLDDTFGNHGHTLADLSAQNRYDERATEILIQSDGKRVVVVDRYPYIQLIRFNADGTYDATFGEGGFSQAARLGHFGGPQSNAAIQSDGKIVVTGETDWNSSTQTDFGVARWNTDGTLDASFGSQGMVITDFGYWDEGNMVRVQPDGKLLVAGRVIINNVSFIGLARYISDGSLDATFGVNGKYVNVPNVELADMGLTPDGKLMVLGDATDDFALVRFNANGFIDTSFGTQGYTVYSWTLGGYHPFIRSLAIQPDGKLLLGGSIYNSVNSDMLVVRYGADGVIDNSFHGDGKQTTHIGGSESVRDLTVQPDGKIVVAGDVYYGSSLPTKFALARYTSSGDLDGTFGVRGTQITSFSGYDGASAAAVALHADGDITAAGAAGKNYGEDVAVATYDVQGAPDEQGYPVQTIGAFYADVGLTYFLASAVQPDEKLVAAGYVWNGLDHDFLVARFNRDGTLDQTFGIGGYSKTDFSAVQEGSGDELARSLAIQPDGKIVLSGSFFGFTVGGALPVARLNSDGSLDPSFGTGGMTLLDLPGVFEEGNAALLQPDGKIVIGGSVLIADFDFMLCRLNTDGTLDGGFGSGGVVTSTFGYQDIVFGLALQPDGKLVASGNTSLPNSFAGFDFCTARYNTDGSVDAGFGTGGRVTTDFDGGFDFAEAIALQGDGGILVGGGAPINDDFDFALARYDADGIPDLSFGIGGKRTLGLLGYDIGTAVALQSDGKVLLAGFTQGTGANYNTVPVDFGLARYGSTGAPDGEFGDLGKVVSDFGGQEFAHSMGLFDRRIYVTGSKRVFREFSGTDKLFGMVAAYITGPPPADELIDDEIDDILNLPGVPHGTKQSLTAKLRAALSSLAAGDTTGACNNLRALLNEVNALTGKKKLTAAQASQLIADVTAIMTTLRCSGQGSQLLANAPTTDTGEVVEVPTRFALERNWPNPFQGSTLFTYQLPVASKVSLKVYNVLGQVVATVVDEDQAPGWKSVRWDVSGLPSGVYYYRLRAGSFAAVRKMLLLR